MTRTTSIVRTCTKGIVALILLACILSLAGCAGFNLDESIGVTEGENALMCANVNVDPAWSESNGSYRRVELPADVDVTQLTPEQIAALYDC